MTFKIFNKKALIIIGAFLFCSATYGQPKNSTFNLLKKINKNLPFEILYFDKDIADTYALELSSLLNNDLSSLGLNVLYPTSSLTIAENEVLLNDYILNSTNNIILITSQSSSTRNTLNGNVYSSGKLIGSFTAFRTIWNNNRLILFSEFISNEIGNNLFE